MKLRPYQVRSVMLIWRAFRAGKRRVLFTLPTGTGKTVVAVEMMRQWLDRGARILFLSGRREHINQCYATLLAYGIPKDDLSVILRKADPRENPEARIQIASKDTLARRSVKPKADVVIVDEAHHCAAKGYVALQAVYATAVWLGLTATPYRLDGKGMAAVFDELVVGAMPSELIALRFMAKPRVFTVPEKERRRLAKSLREVRSFKGDYVAAALGKILTKHRRLLVGDLLRYWQKYGRGKPTVVYAVNRHHARQIVKLFADAGVAVELLTGTTPTDVRDAMIGGARGWKESRLARGETKVVVNCAVLVEGWDCPPAKCIMIARPTKSLAFWIHACGRALRKTNVRPIILDHAGNALRAGIRCLPHEDLELALDVGAGKRTGRSAPAGPRACPKCDAVVARQAEQCPECGHVFAKEPEHVDGKLKEMTEEDAAAARRKEERRLLRLAEAGSIPRQFVAPYLAARFAH